MLIKLILSNIFFTIYIKLIRPWTSPLFYYLIKIFKYKFFSNNEKLQLKLKNWEDIKDLKITEFSKILNQYDYRLDPLGGVLDNSPRDKHFFFKSLMCSRDCAAYSRLWKYYFDYHGIESKEVAMLKLDNIDGLSIKDILSDGLSAHMVTVARIDGKWELFDYRPTDKRVDSIKNALKNNVVGYDKFMHTEYKDRFYILLIIIIIIILIFLI